MEIKDSRIDAGKAFDWGRVSSDYAKYRDIYPDAFYQRIISTGLCVKGQKVLDLGTGTGVLPRNLYKYGAKWTGTDISANQIAQAKRLAEEGNMDIEFLTVSAEDLDFDDESFDVITACQCFWYFRPETVIPKLAKLLKPKGSLLIMNMAWLPYEDEIAGKSEALVVKYSPKWTGAGETRHPVKIPAIAYDCFELQFNEVFDLMVPFTRETWNGRMKACRGVGASLSPQEIESWEAENKKLLEETAPEEFEILHYAAFAQLKKKEIKKHE